MSKFSLKKQVFYLFREFFFGSPGIHQLILVPSRRCRHQLKEEGEKEGKKGKEGGKKEKKGKEGGKKGEKKRRKRREHQNMDPKIGVSTRRARAPRSRRFSKNLCRFPFFPEHSRTMPRAGPRAGPPRELDAFFRTFTDFTDKTQKTSKRLCVH